MNQGDVAPDFTLSDQDGQPRRLYDLLAAGPVVLFFYPQAHTTGCTKEACHFRDVAKEFNDAGAQRVGISLDAVDKQQSFATKNNLDYPLLSDADGAVARSFGVKRGLDLLKVKRSTFVIGTDHTIKAKITSELNMNVHADKALAALRQS
jgi:peroxiredoxin Q/BCP